ncbi:MAG: DUF4272 domain-containing protein [Spirochaetales bacterium]|nr:DUF4272 domain-containing protein [Spirochaetales bacterium]
MILSKKSQERKNRSLKILEQNLIPLDESLPGIQDEAATILRSKNDVVKRAMCLLIVSLKGAGLEQEKVNQLVQKYDVRNYFSPRETQFMAHPDPPADERNQYSWRYESYWVLLWALHYVDKLDFPVSICDVDKAVAILGTMGKVNFEKNARLRSETEILDEADLVYRYLGAADKAMANNEAIPGNLNPDVLQERLLALRWLIGYDGKEWDEVDTRVRID